MYHTGVRSTGSRRQARMKRSFTARHRTSPGCPRPERVGSRGTIERRTSGGEMELCLMIEGQEGVTWDQWTALAAACEEHGLAGLFRSDHYLSFDDEGRAGSSDAWATLAALAARTERIRLGTLVSPATFRPPGVLAMNAITVDHVSGGRVDVGMGAGWFEREHVAFGFPFPDRSTRIAMLAEQLEIVHRAFSEERFSFDGRHYRVDDLAALPKP